MRLGDLKRIGLTEGEIRVYEALLELGETTRTELARKSGISASKIYDVANRLLEKGIISAVRKGGVLHFSAASPERLRDFVEGKEAEIAEEKKIVESLMPALLAGYAEAKEKRDVEVFYGWEGMKTAFWEKLRELGKGDINYVIGASAGADSRQADIFFSKYFGEVEKRGYGVRIIFNENVRGNRERAGYFEGSPRHKVRYLYQDTFAELDVYKDTVLVVMLLKKPIIARIRSREAADSFRKYFESAWRQAKG